MLAFPPIPKNKIIKHKGIPNNKDPIEEIFTTGYQTLFDCCKKGV